jgi:hypothetical protein
MSPGRSAPHWAPLAVALGSLLCLSVLLLGARRQAAAALAGPLAPLGASLAFLRADLAMQAGEAGLALGRAEAALRLAPQNPDGWASLVLWQGGTLASAVRESDLERRRAWLEAALATAERARGQARPFAPVAAAAAAVLWAQAESEPALPWPGGREGLAGLAQRYALEADPGMR